jgi:hypothetical protein
MIGIPTAISSGPDLRIWLVLAICLAASVGVFIYLIRRETVRRRNLLMRQWAAQRGLNELELQSPHAKARLGPIASIAVKIFRIYADDSVAIVQVKTRESELTGASSPFWNLLIRQLSSKWEPTALRPTALDACLIDLMPITSFPSLLTHPQFVVFGSDSRSARVLASGLPLKILPPDIGLLLEDNLLFLDFTDRPFDEIEFERMLELSRQLAERLPNLDEARTAELPRDF